ncbi:efflux RND transporter periplasmic adaptor subunit [Coralloluteibacterium stylophorae]|uniref:Efflux RND transporter periplasmic adaptor subunit n=2 Tax=Coralloluteibacterium stylophorae TaxID=1776034 RepID=A0AAP2CDM5_9GAMM|nr:efflux RND transporter periplasmic adaptor subunit [Coralloluteibacterium stylophorae]MBS7458364.1 efflux RND transporter periplasmic adaptor subunit [Coralloluteibacterium stylophorae]
MISKRHRAAAALALGSALLVSACGGGAGGSVDAAATAPVVTTTVVEPSPWRDRIQALGTTQANESVVITAKVSETVRRVNFDSGDRVKEGELLVDLSGNTQLAALEEARAAYEEADRLFERQQDLAGRRLVSESVLDTQRAQRDSARARMRQIQAQLGDRAITAPFDGVLGLRQVSPGSLVTPGTPIANLDDVSTIKLDFAVPELNLGQVAVGQDIAARSAAFPELEFTGTVTSLDSRVDPVTRAVTVRAEFPNPDGVLRPGMLMSVDLLQPVREVLAIPELALVQIGRESSVFRVNGDETVTQVPVETGARRRGEVEIVDGLAAGDRIVVEGTNKLRSGIRIAVAPVEATPAQDTAPAAAAGIPAAAP